MPANIKDAAQTESGPSLAEAMGSGPGTVAKQQGLLKRSYPTHDEDEEAKERIGNLFQSFMKHPGSK